MASFHIDWDNKTLTCPEGRQSVRWSENQDRSGTKYDPHRLLAGRLHRMPESRSSCTRAKDLPRTLTLQPREEHEAIQFARKRQKTEGFASLYSRRAGIEGTVSHKE